jgi:O-antigen ligase
VIALSPIVAALLISPGLAAAASTLTLPFASGVTATAAGLQISVSDILLVTAAIATTGMLVMSPSVHQRLVGFRGVLMWSLPFTIWLLCLVLLHPSLRGLAKTMQDLALYLLPMFVGAVALTTRGAIWIRTGFVVGSVALAIGWVAIPESAFLGQKNPAGQFMVDGIILSLATIASWRWRIVTLVPLAIGLVATHSRGAIVGLGLGLLILLFARMHRWSKNQWRWVLSPVVAAGFVLVIVATLNLAPEVFGTAVDFQNSQDFSFPSRQVYRINAIDLIREHPVTGVGVGNYETGASGFTSTDPHNVLLRTAADGGLPALAAFLILVAGTSIAVWRRRQLNYFAAAALAIQVAILTHALIDVYWVRGTPVIGWLLVGMAFNPLLTRKADRDAGPE